MRTAKAKVTEVRFFCPACGCGLNEQWNEVDGIVTDTGAEEQKFNHNSFHCPDCGRELFIPKTARVALIR